MSLFDHLIRLTNDPALREGFHEVSDAEMARDPSEEPPPIDFGPLADAGRITVNWLVDVARSRTTDADDHAAIDRVRATTLASLDQTPFPARARASEEDILTVLGILVTAFETSFRIPGLADLFGALYDAGDQVAKEAIAATQAAAPRRYVLPLVMHRRPRVAHGLEDAVPIRSIVIVR